MPTGRNSDPSVHRRRLGRALRDARSAAELTQRDAHTAMEWSVSKLLRIEAGSSTITTNDLRALLNLYKVSDEDAELLVEEARAARGSSRWNVYRGVASAEYLAFLGFESSATIIRTFEPLLVPGLLQTEDYARAVIGTLEAESPGRIEPLVDLRIERQESLLGHQSPQLHFILDEAVIRRTVDSRTTTRHQLGRLVEAAELPNVTIRIVPFDMGLYPKLRVPYTLFEFDDQDENTLYVEGPLGEQITKDNWPGSADRSNPAQPEVFLAEFWKLEHLTNGVDPIEMIRSALRDLG